MSALVTLGIPATVTVADAIGLAGAAMLSGLLAGAWVGFLIGVSEAAANNTDLQDTSLPDMRRADF